MTKPRKLNTEEMLKAAILLECRAAGKPDREPGVSDFMGGRSERGLRARLAVYGVDPDAFTGLPSVREGGSK